MIPEHPNTLTDSIIWPLLALSSVQSQLFPSRRLPLAFWPRCTSSCPIYDLGRPTEWSHHRRATPWPTYVITMVDAYISDIAIFSPALVIIFENFHDLCIYFKRHNIIISRTSLLFPRMEYSKRDLIYLFWYYNWELFSTWLEII